MTPLLVSLSSLRTYATERVLCVNTFWREGVSLAGVRRVAGTALRADVIRSDSPPPFPCSPFRQFAVACLSLLRQTQQVHTFSKSQLIFFILARLFSESPLFFFTTTILPERFFRLRTSCLSQGIYCRTANSSVRILDGCRYLARPLAIVPIA